MRYLITLILFLTLCTSQAQRPGISTLLSMIECRDTTCVNAHALTWGYCSAGGKDKDGWLWVNCNALADSSLWDDVDLLIMGFYGLMPDHYRRYQLGTRDSTIAAILTMELEQLGFVVDKPHPEGHYYSNPAYPSLSIERLEKRASSIKTSDLSGKPRPVPKTEQERLMQEDMDKYMRELGIEDYEVVPELMWVFKVVVDPR